MPGAPAEEELRARAVLAEMLLRISKGPYVTLNIQDSASPEEVRGAFLALTKQFHPARFGRTSAEMQKVANEVFLGIKTAHDQLIKQLGASGRPASRASGSPPPPSNNLNPATVRGTGLLPKVGQPGQSGQIPVQAAARPTVQPQPTRPAVSRTLTPPFAGAAATPRSGTPQPVRATPVTSTASTNVPGPAQVRGGSAAYPIARPSTPVNQRPGTPPSDIPSTTRPTAPAGIARPQSPSPGAAAGSGSVRAATSSGSSQSIPRANDEASDLRQALAHLSSRDWNAARLVLHSLAARNPQSRQYRSLLCYVRGRETQSVGRGDDAALEFQRALQLDPDLQLAKDALRELGKLRP